jgi:predicted TPR repeat methyltransferase
MLHAIQTFFQRHAAHTMFSRWSPSYEEDVTQNAYSAPDKVAEAALRHIAAMDIYEPRIADIGIGTGMLSEQIFSAMPSRITGLDFAEDMMAQCLQKEITEILIKCDAGKDRWPFEDGTYEAVISAGLIEYFTPPMVQHFISESARSLTQNGVLVFTYVPTNETNEEIKLWRGKSGIFLSCQYNPAALEKDLIEAGFEITEHSDEFAGCIFKDGSSYSYRLIVAKKK